MIAILFVISMLLCSNMVSFMTGRQGGLPDSISAMVFQMKHPWSWSVWLWAVTITLAPALMEAMPKEYQVFAFGFLACMLFTGICPLFDTQKRKWHYPLAFIGGVLSQACVWKICPWCLLLLVLMAAYVLAGMTAINDKKVESPYDGKGVIIAELIAIVAVYSSITIKLYL